MLEIGKEIIIKGKPYTIVDGYDSVRGLDPILILHRDSKFYIQNYENMGIFMGPYEDALKTGDNGEILVREKNKKFYYVPGISERKPYDYPFQKEYHPEYHYAEPYTYQPGVSATVVKMEDGSKRIKYSSGSISEPYKNCILGDICVYEHLDGRVVGSSRGLTLPLNGRIYEDDNQYSNPYETNYRALEAFGKYAKGVTELADLENEFFIVDDFVKAVLDSEKQRIFKMLDNVFGDTRQLLHDAGQESIEKLDEVDIDESIITNELNRIAEVVTQKRTTAVYERQKQEKVTKLEEKTVKKVFSVLDFDKIAKKSNSKSKKKPVSTPASESSEENGPIQGGGQ